MIHPFYDWILIGSNDLTYVPFLSRIFLTDTPVQVRGFGGETTMKAPMLATAAVFLAPISPVHAQAEAADDQAIGGGIAEFIVTAQRRSENLQKRQQP